jgi:hypothetical protein
MTNDAKPPQTATSFKADILPLFSARDIAAMAWRLNLAAYDDVKANAALIQNRIQAIGGTVMPPPPPRGDGPWPPANIALFKQWLIDGCPP